MDRHPYTPLTHNPHAQDTPSTVEVASTTPLSHQSTTAAWPSNDVAGSNLMRISCPRGMCVLRQLGDYSPAFNQTSHRRIHDIAANEKENAPHDR